MSFLLMTLSSTPPSLPAADWGLKGRDFIEVVDQISFQVQDLQSLCGGKRILSQGHGQWMDGTRLVMLLILLYRISYVESVE